MPTNDIGIPHHDTFVAIRKKAVVHHQGPIEYLKFISGRFEIPMQQWIIQGNLLRNALFQKRLTDLFSCNA